LKKIKKSLKQNKKVALFLLLWRHKKKWFINNSKKLYQHSKENNKKFFGLFLIFRMLFTEIVFLKEKNESAAEYGYMLPNMGMSDTEIIEKHFKGNYKFEFMDAFTSNINMWYKFFRKKKLLNKKIKYLEIGSFEGRSSVFVLENLPNSIGFFVDPFQDYEEMKDSTGQKDFNKIYNNFLFNIKSFDNRTNVFKKTSDEFFLKNDKKYDLIYVDGSHFGEDVYRDAVNSFKCLNIGGYIIFDDFFWFFFDTVNENPLGGIFRFLIENKQNIRINYVSNQLIIQKK